MRNLNILRGENRDRRADFDWTALSSGYDWLPARFRTAVGLLHFLHVDCVLLIRNLVPLIRIVTSHITAN